MFQFFFQGTQSSREGKSSKQKKSHVQKTSMKKAGEKDKPKKKKRVSFRDPLERDESDISVASKHKMHQVSASIVDISSMLENPAYQVELSDYDMPQISFAGTCNRACMSGVRVDYLITATFQLHNS